MDKTRVMPFLLKGATGFRNQETRNGNEMLFFSMMEAGEGVIYPDG